MKIRKRRKLIAYYRIAQMRKIMSYMFYLGKALLSFGKDQPTWISVYKKDGVVTPVTQFTADQIVQKHIDTILMSGRRTGKTTLMNLVITHCSLSICLINRQLARLTDPKTAATLYARFSYQLTEPLKPNTVITL